MTIKNAREVIEMAKKFFTKVGESKIWQKLFVSRIDYRMVDEMKRGMQIKYGMTRFY